MNPSPRSSSSVACRNSVGTNGSRCSPSPLEQAHRVGEAPAGVARVPARLPDLLDGTEQHRAHLLQRAHSRASHAFRGLDGRLDVLLHLVDAADRLLEKPVGLVHIGLAAALGGLLQEALGLLQRRVRLLEGAQALLRLVVGLADAGPDLLDARHATAPVPAPVLRAKSSPHHPSTEGHPQRGGGLRCVPSCPGVVRRSKVSPSHAERRDDGERGQSSAPAGEVDRRHRVHDRGPRGLRTHGGAAGRADHGLPGGLQRPVLLPGPGERALPVGRAGARRPHRAADAGARPRNRHGAGRAGLRGRGRRATTTTPPR